MINLPSDSYNNAAGAEFDPDETTNYNIPIDFKGTGFLIARITMRHQVAGGGTWTEILTADLRGLFPSVAVGNFFPSAASDASLVNYLPAGTGAVATTSQAKHRERVSVFDFMTAAEVADVQAETALVDVSTALNTADASAVITGLPLSMPGGKYLVNSQFAISAGVSIDGAGSQAVTILTGGDFNTVSLGTGASLKGVTVDGNSKTNTNGSGVLVPSVNSVILDDVISKDHGFHGIALSNAFGCRLTNIECNDNGQRGLIIDPNSYSNKVDGIRADGNTEAGILIGHNSHHNIITNFILTGTDNIQLWIHNEAYNNIVTVGDISAPNSNFGNGVPAIMLGYNAYKNNVGDIQISGHLEGVLLRGAVVDATYTAGNTRKNNIHDITIVGRGVAVANGASIKLDSLDSGTTISDRNLITNIIASDIFYGLWDASGHATNNKILACDFTENINTVESFSAANGNIVGDIEGLTPVGFLSTAPAVPATTVSVTNDFVYSVSIYITGMVSGSNVQIGIAGVDPTTAPNDGNGMYILSPGENITLTYASGNPAWRWFGLR